VTVCPEPTDGHPGDGCDCEVCTGWRARQRLADRFEAEGREDLGKLYRWRIC